MKTIFNFQHTIGGEIVEEGASFNIGQIMRRVKEIEDESTGADVSEEDYELDIDDDGDVWIRNETPNSASPEVLYYSYDQYAREAGQDEIEIVVKEIPFMD